MKPLFKDTAIQHQFDQQGYIVIPLLSGKQVNTLLELYRQQIPADGVSGLYESSRHNSFEVNELINKAIYGEMKQSAEAIFLPSQMYGGTFMVKSNCQTEMLPLHQDWSVVEEDQFNTIFIWCPLVDVTPENGGLFVLEGSHLYFNSLRSGSYPSNRYILPLQLHQYTKNIFLKAGEAICYFDKLFHGSYANNTKEDRIVVTARVMEEAATLVYFHKANENEVDVYQADSTFYLTQIDSIAKGHAPSHIPKLYTRPYTHTEVTDASLQRKIQEQYTTPKHSAMNCQLFKDYRLQKTFEEEGYVVIDLISDEQVQSLYSFYQSLENAPIPQYGFHVSLDNQSPEFVQRISEKLIHTVQSNVENYFKDYQIFTASFVVKEKNPMGVVPPHQDWTFVDEQQYWSATIWCPLVDTNMDNGGLGVIKGSHLFYDHVRPSPSPQYEPPFKHQLITIFPYLKIVVLKAGQALVFNNKTIHGSPPNTTDQTRISFGIGITHKDAAIQHYYKLPRQQQRIEGYRVGLDFFYRYNNARLSAIYERGEKPSDLPSAGVFAYTCKQYDTAGLIEKIEAAGNEKDDALIRKMAALYGYNVNAVTTEEANHHKQKMPLWKIYTPGNIYREIRFRLSSRPFWKVYTPGNVLREIKYRITRNSREN